MPTLRQFQYLVAVAETLNFRRAAERCHVTQPTLSDQIKRLEERLDVQLVERAQRRVVMTPIGLQIAERARGVIRDVQDIIDIADRGRHMLAGTLRLGVLPSLGPYLLPEILPALHDTYPDLTLYLREDMADNLLHRLEDGELDLLIFPLPITRTDFSAVELFDEPLWLAVPKDHKLAAKKMLAPSDLKGLTVLALEHGHSMHRQVLALCDKYGAKPLLDYSTTSLDTMRQMAGMEMGATFLPALYVRAEARQDPQLAVRRFSKAEPKRKIGLIWRQQTARRAEFLALADQVRDILSRNVPEVQPLG